MTSKIDKHVPAGTPTLVVAEPEAAPGAGGPPPGGEAVLATPASASARAERRKLHAERVQRWSEIQAAGGIDAWVTQQLASKGLVGGGGGGGGKAEVKERKKAEARERRALRRQAWEAYHATHVTHLGAGIHWDELTDPDRWDVADRRARADGLGLPALETADDLAAALGMDVAKLRWFTFHRDVDKSSHYESWTIPKRDGTARTITSPKKDLKAAQRWALRHVFERLPVHGAAHGFLAARSVASNARLHAGAEVVVKLDIKDFFPTVTWRRVKGLLRKAGVAERPATLLALLATEAPRDLVEHRGERLWVARGPRALPQGAPTSPAVTNAICLRLDRRLSGLARKLGFRYTRYADDLTFSWSRPQQPADAAGAAAPAAKPAVGVLVSTARRILVEEGFRPHPKKTQILGRGSRQRITGLVVNAAPPTAAAPTQAAAQPGGQADGVSAPAPARVPRDVLRRLRAALHNRERGRAHPDAPAETLEQLRGLAAYVFMVDPAKGRALLERIDRLRAGAGSDAAAPPPPGPASDDGPASESEK